ncbi:MAG: helix-turn-helix transcriptional regulator [Chloroflexota bacterium]|nr:helix-turn-helix transcriptional regulator [Chloroflexota bacterium]
MTTQDKKGGLKNNNTNDQPDLGSKAFLTPYMLLMLRDLSLHGYQIWQRLMSMDLPGLNEHDRPAVYRILRQLEEDGKVASYWDTADKSGPARRVYSLTDTGKDFLGLWADGLDQYRRTLDFFFKMYTGGIVPSPFDFEKTSGGEKKDGAEGK